jgi:hypothetical protein
VSDFKQIHSALYRIFHEEDQRIVFWNDPDREFLDALPTILVEGVRAGISPTPSISITYGRLDSLS